MCVRVSVMCINLGEYSMSFGLFDAFNVCLSMHNVCLDSDMLGCSLCAWSSLFVQGSLCALGCL